MRDILTASISRMPWKLWNRWLISWTTLFRVLANWLTIPKRDGVSKSGKSTALNSYIGKGLKRLWFPSLKRAYDINSKSRSDVLEFFSLSSLLFFFCNIIFGNCPPPPPPPKKKMALRCRQVCENEDDKDRCTLNRDLEGIKGTQFFISLEKTCYWLKKTSVVIHSAGEFYFRDYDFSRAILVNCLTSP